MSSNLAGQTVVVVGGSSGIGYGVAKASLLQHAARVIIGSSSKEKVKGAVKRLQAVTASSAAPGTVSGKVIDASDSDSIKAFFEKLGEIDHLVWTCGPPPRFGEKGLEDGREMFDVRFWGAVTAAKVAKFRKEGSVTFTTGMALLTPPPGWSIASATFGAVDGISRGLAVDMAPIRVNTVAPGSVKTELWETLPAEIVAQRFSEMEKSLLVKHVADADEIAEAYLFLMKCKYITGQRLEVEGGAKYGH